MEASWGESKTYIFTHNTKLPEEKGDLKGTTKASLTKVIQVWWGPTDQENQRHCKDCYSQISRWEQPVPQGRRRGCRRHQGQSEGREEGSGRDFTGFCGKEGSKVSRLHTGEMDDFSRL